MYLNHCFPMYFAEQHHNTVVRFDAQIKNKNCIEGVKQGNFLENAAERII